MINIYNPADGFAALLGVDSLDDLLGTLVEIDYMGDNTVSYHARFRWLGTRDDASIMWIGVLDPRDGTPICIPWHAIATVAALDEPDDNT